jgi:hypothetical protein
MNLALSSSMDVLIFIVFCSFYVCSVLWIYGDAATRNAGWKGLILPLAFVIVGTLALVKGEYLALLIWPLGYLVWFIKRPEEVSYS